MRKISRVIADSLDIYKRLALWNIEPNGSITFRKGRGPDLASLGQVIFMVSTTQIRQRLLAGRFPLDYSDG